MLKQIKRNIYIYINLDLKLLAEIRISISNF